MAVLTSKKLAYRFFIAAEKSNGECLKIDLENKTRKYVELKAIELINNDWDVTIHRITPSNNKGRIIAFGNIQTGLLLKDSKKMGNAGILGDESIKKILNQIFNGELKSIRDIAHQENTTNSYAGHITHKIKAYIASHVIQSEDATTVYKELCAQYRGKDKGNKLIQFLNNQERINLLNGNE